ncbi:hypothetical protein [Bartonella schoenbuchensis]
MERGGEEGMGRCVGCRWVMCGWKGVLEGVGGSRLAVLVRKNGFWEGGC